MKEQGNTPQCDAVQFAKDYLALKVTLATGDEIVKVCRALVALSETLRREDQRDQQAAEEAGGKISDTSDDKKDDAPYPQEIINYLNECVESQSDAWPLTKVQVSKTVIDDIVTLLSMRSAVARSDLADELARLGSKATQGPWSSNILQDFLGHSGSNDTPYVYGPESHPKLLMGLWPIHPPEETAAVEQRMFDTLSLICALRNHLPEIIAALRTQSAIGAIPTKMTPRNDFNKYQAGYHDGWNECVDAMLRTSDRTMPDDG